MGSWIFLLGSWVLVVFSFVDWLDGSYYFGWLFPLLLFWSALGPVLGLDSL